MLVSQSTENVRGICFIFLEEYLVVFAKMLTRLNLNYGLLGWRLILDFSKLSLKAVLIYSGNNILIIIGHTV